MNKILIIGIIIAIISGGIYYLIFDYRILYPPGEKPCNDQSLQCEISNAPAGSTINIAEGDYYLKGIHIGKSLTLNGAGIDKTIFHYDVNYHTSIEPYIFEAWSSCSDRSGCAPHVIIENMTLISNQQCNQITGDYLDVRNVKFMGSNDTSKIGTLQEVGIESRTYDKHLVVKNCFFSGFEDEAMCILGDNFLIENCVFNYNSEAIEIWWMNDSLVKNCEFKNNSYVQFLGGSYSFGSHDDIFQNCLFSDILNTAAIEIPYDNGKNYDITAVGCTFHNCPLGTIHWY